MSVATALYIDDGIDEAQRRRIADRLARILADTYVLYLKAQFYHWNVTGPMFHSLHQMFEENYKDLAEAADLIAERIRALGFPAPGTFREFSSLSSLKEDDNIPTAEEMIRGLIDGHEAVTRGARELAAGAEKAGDQVTLDLMAERMEAHEKNAWMLRSQLS